jgi:DNA primase
VIDADSGITKGELAAYYGAVAPLLQIDTRQGLLSAARFQEAALLVKTLLDELRLPSFLRFATGNTPWDAMERSRTGLRAAMQMLGFTPS